MPADRVPPTPIASRFSANLRGMAMMAASTVCFAAMHAAVRHLSETLHPFEVTFFRNLFGIFVVIPLLMRGGLGILRTTQWGLHWARAILQLASMFAFFYALSITPLADAAALGFTAPICVTLLGMAFLGERVGIRRWSAIVVGFLGTFLILRPGFAEVGLGQALVLASSLLWGWCLLVIKILGRTESSATITAYMVILMAPLSLGPALFVWQWPSGEQLAWAIFIGSIGTLGQFLMIYSVKVAETSVVMPLDFLKLIWAALLGYFFFAQVPDLWTWLGGTVIFGSAAYIAWREHVLRRGKG